MNVTVAKKWAAELRSTLSGQTTGRLRETVEDCPHPAFCVMGVLCDLYMRERGGEWKEHTVRNEAGAVVDRQWTCGDELICGDGYHSIAPPEVLKWAGLRSCPQINVYPVLTEAARRDCVEPACYADFMEANDQYGVSFEQFADLIEQQAHRL